MRQQWPQGLWIVVLLGFASIVWHGMRMPAHPTLQVVYLVPSDVDPKPEFAEGARMAMTAVQRWYFDELKSSVTFGFADPLVRMVHTRHPERWYNASAGKQDNREALWNATIDEAFSLTGGSYNDPEHVWLYFLDADLPAIPAQGTSGVTLLLREEVSNLVGLQPRCYTIGTIAHELGHAFGLKHPPDCDSHKKSDTDVECESMSYLGGNDFPNAEFLPEERDRLLRSPAFAAVVPESSAVRCSQ